MPRRVRDHRAQGGSDVNAMRTTARRDGDEWVLNGEKCYVTNGGIAELTLVFARAEGGSPRSSSSAAIRGSRPGARRTRSACAPRYTGRSSSTTRASPPTACSARKAAASRRDGLLRALAAQVAAGAVGVARAAFEYATEYARERKAFGKPILAKQGVSFKLADMAMEIEASRLLIWRACAALDAGEDAGLLGSYAKAFAADAAMRATTDAVQILGGAGIMRDHPVEKWIRDAKVFQIVEGTSEIQRHVIAGYLRNG